jgi:hypothetical protein
MEGWTAEVRLDGIRRRLDITHLAAGASEWLP